MTKRAGFLFVAVLILSPAAFASYAIYVGKNLTEDGSVFIGGSGDEVSSHWLEVVPAKDHPAGSTITVGVDSEANMPGEFTEIPQSRHTYRYLTMDYSEYMGFPPPITNGGLNENNVAGRDVWSPSRAELVEMTPNPQTGPQYSDLSRIAMERARTAREAVEIIGGLIDEHGYSTYGGNSHMFADEDEGWVFLDFAGGQGLWIAERLGPDDVRMSYPGYINDIPLDLKKSNDFLASDNFISFAVEQGWFDPEGDEAFNVSKVYGNNPERSPRSDMERELRADAPIDLRRMMDAVRDPRVSMDSTGYGQVAQLKDNGRNDMNLLWVAPTQSVTAPFIPYRVSVQKIAPQFGKHRYLTKGEARKFLNEDWQIQEATEFAGRTFKRLLYYTCDHPEKFYPEVNEALTAFENRLIAEQESLVAIANTLFDEGKDDLAREYLTDYSWRTGQDALQLGNALLRSIEVRTREVYGWREPKGDVVSGFSQRINCNQ